MLCVSKVAVTEALRIASVRTSVRAPAGSSRTCRSKDSVFTSVFLARQRNAYFTLDIASFVAIPDLHTGL